MPVVRRKSIPQNDWRFGEALVGAINGVNAVFTAPDIFIHQVPGLTIAVYFNGVRQVLTDDYTLSESGGAGAGFDTVTMLSPPESGDKLTADYVIAP